MKIYINDNELDFTLENEKTCGDVLNQIQIQFEKDNATIIGINIDGKNISVEEIDSLSQVGIEDVEIIKIIAVSAEHIKETLIALSYNFDKINQGFEDFPVLLQGNNMVKVSEVLKNFADDFDLLCRTVSLTALFPEYFADRKQSCRFYKRIFTIFGRFRKRNQRKWYSNNWRYCWIWN